MTRPQALTTGWRDSSCRPLSRTTVPEPALTRAVRTALAPDGLRTALHTIQNVCRRTVSSRVLSREPIPPTRLSTRGKQHRAPVCSTSLVLASCSATPRSKGASAPIELDHVFTARAFRRRAAVTKDASDRRLQSHISKMSTRTSRGYRPAPRSCPRCLPMNVTVHAVPSALVGNSIAAPGVLFPSAALGAPNL